MFFTTTCTTDLSEFKYSSQNDAVSEMEKKKQKLCELQMRRREEQELRRIKLEMEQIRKREASQ